MEKHSGIRYKKNDMVAVSRFQAQKFFSKEGAQGKWHFFAGGFLVLGVPVEFHQLNHSEYNLKLYVSEPLSGLIIQEN